MLAALGPYCFWALSRSMFEENFRFRPWHVLVVSFMVFTAFTRTILETGFSGFQLKMLNLGVLLPSVLLVLHAMWIVLRDHGVDLVESRRRFRWVFLIAGGCLTLTSLAIHWFRGSNMLVTEVSLIQASVFLLLKIVLAVQVIEFSYLLEENKNLQGKPGGENIIESTPGNDNAYQAERIVAAMQRDCLYLKTGLTIGKLAERLDLPEYRLRKLINQHLGYRNFNDFINFWRMEEALKRLKDPSLARIPILTIALDLGYGSIGPFNRAFKISTGITPSEFRRIHSGNTMTDS